VAERSDVIRNEIEQTREELGETVDALSYKANVPARTKSWAADKKDALVSNVSGRKDAVASKIGVFGPDGQTVKQRKLRLKDTAERNPIGLAIAGAAAGFLAGLFTPSTRVEDEKLGPIADHVKSTASDAGHDALDHGKQVAQAAAQSALETAKEESKQHGEELSSSLQEKAREVTPTSGPQ
jgi:hypothetical protein